MKLQDIFNRPIFSFLAAVGLVSIVSNFVSLAEDIKVLTNAWKAVTRPIWEASVGLIFERYGWIPAPLLSDYLSMGTITLVGAIRAWFSFPKARKILLYHMPLPSFVKLGFRLRSIELPINVLYSFALWPIFILTTILKYWTLSSAQREIVQLSKVKELERLIHEEMKSIDLKDLDAPYIPGNIPALLQAYPETANRYSTQQAYLSFITTAVWVFIILGIGYGLQLATK